MTETGLIDLLVIGGGINGAGIARDAAGRGLSVILCEKDDLAEGCSSRSCAVQPSSSRRALMQGVRVSTSAPFSAAPTAFSTTSRASSTQQSEYSKPRVYLSRSGAPSGSLRRSSARVPGSFLRPPRWS